jgi:hypothetical protein
VTSQEAGQPGDEADEALDGQLGTCTHHEGALVMVALTIAIGFAAYRQCRWADLRSATGDLELESCRCSFGFDELPCGIELDGTPSAKQPSAQDDIRREG